MPYADEGIMDYKSFLRENGRKVNRYLNMVLWCFVPVGPAIAIGIWTGPFAMLGYGIALQILVTTLVLALVHFLLLKKWPYSVVTSMFALLGIDIFLAYLNVAHVGIRLTWCLVPLLSLLFCDSRIYFASVAINYVLMCTATWMLAPFMAEQRIDYESAAAFMANTAGGYTIETIIMGGAGYALGRLASGYFKDLISQHKLILEREVQAREHFEILDSMAEIYDKVNLLDFDRKIERPMTGGTREEYALDLSKQTHTRLVSSLMGTVAADQVEAFAKFTDITTIQNRLGSRKSITGEFVDKVRGWFRAQYIVAKRDENEYPIVIIFTIQNIEEEKRKEEHLIRIAMTDGLTRLYNRRCYEDDILRYKTENMERNLALFSLDVNGLKVANDTKGHAAGDELIKGAADCLLEAVGLRGKAYRTGGDEFMAVVHTEDCTKLLNDIKSRAMAWRGEYVDNLSVSVGYAAHADHPELGIVDLEKLADRMMYEDKADYYHRNGRDRRKL